MCVADQFFAGAVTIVIVGAALLFIIALVVLTGISFIIVTFFVIDSVEDVLNSGFNVELKVVKLLEIATARIFWHIGACMHVHGDKRRGCDSD
jgi:hypothetical protein